MLNLNSKFFENKITRYTTIDGVSILGKVGGGPISKRCVSSFGTIVGSLKKCDCIRDIHIEKQMYHGFCPKS